MLSKLENCQSQTDQRSENDKTRSMAGWLHKRYKQKSVDLFVPVSNAVDKDDCMEKARGYWLCARYRERFRDTYVPEEERDFGHDYAISAAKQRAMEYTRLANEISRNKGKISPSFIYFHPLAPGLDCEDDIENVENGNDDDQGPVAASTNPSGDNKRRRLRSGTLSDEEFLARAVRRNFVCILNALAKHVITRCRERRLNFPSEICVAVAATIFATTRDIKQCKIVASNDRALLSIGLSCLRKAKAGHNMVKSALSVLPCLKGKDVDALDEDEFLMLSATLIDLIIAWDSSPEKRKATSIKSRLRV